MWLQCVELVVLGLHSSAYSGTYRVTAVVSDLTFPSGEYEISSTKGYYVYINI